MRFLAIIPTYIIWHYTTAFKDLNTLADNILWFVFNFFSINILSETLFSPWRRLSKDDTVENPSFFSNLVVNVLMRISGFVIRSSVIISGIVSLVFCAAIAVAMFLVWLFLPFLIVFFFLYGISFFNG